MKRNLKISIMVIISLAIIFLLSSKSQANYQSIYQSRPSNYKLVSQSKWINSIRNMENDGQVMGLKETIDDESLLSTSGSNNIDVHMTKNTEYGAMVLLSASAEYGKQGEGTARYVIHGEGLTTTTGNVYGVYMDDLTVNGKSEAVAASEDIAGSYSYNLSISPRYVNRYSTREKTNIDGDAMLKWHGTTATPYYQFFMFRGSSSQGIFYQNATTNNTIYSRACIVNGTGF